jgi:hypothetical protein
MNVNTVGDTTGISSSNEVTLRGVGDSSVRLFAPINARSVTLTSDLADIVAGAQVTATGDVVMKGNNVSLLSTIDTSAGTGGVSITAGRQIYASSGSILTSSGGVTLLANQSRDNPDGFIGVDLENTPVTSSTGDLVVKGIGGGGVR